MLVLKHYACCLSVVFLYLVRMWKCRPRPQRIFLCNHRNLGHVSSRSTARRRRKSSSGSRAACARSTTRPAATWVGTSRRTARWTAPTPSSAPTAARPTSACPLSACTSSRTASSTSAMWVLFSTGLVPFLIWLVKLWHSTGQCTRIKVKNRFFGVVEGTRLLPILDRYILSIL